jgi:hypothetical protein
MPPFTKINQHPRRYRPFSRPLVLHSTFTPEQHSCASHSLFVTYPIASDPTIFETPQPLVPRQAGPSAASYFASVVRETPQGKIRKPPGEAGRPGPGRHGYSLSTVLKWPEEVYKEVQAGDLDLFFSRRFSFCCRPLSINWLLKICLSRPSQIKTLINSTLSIQRLVPASSWSFAC